MDPDLSPDVKKDLKEFNNSVTQWVKRFILA
jgi:hypothetical protein